MSLYVTFNGRLGNDAEVKTSAKGNQFVSFTVAVDEYDSATKQRVTNWVRVTDFSSKATNMLPYLRKGTSVFVTGTLTCGAYLDKTNNDSDKQSQLLTIGYNSVGNQNILR